MSRIERIGAATLYLGDCLEILPTLPKVDAVITDPPYGINAARTRNSQKDGWVDYGVDGWDKDRPGRQVFDLMRSAAPLQIIWGGNYFTDYLPPTMQWLAWDKGQDGFSLADFELAWSSQNKAARRIHYARALAMKDGKEHPTQKPVAVMRWCLEHAGRPTMTLDPFMGSGTTGVACTQMGLGFIGVEREPKYFDIACRRIEETQKQAALFPPEAPAPIQQEIDA
jgi:DNA modification methylase